MVARVWVGSEFLGRLLYVVQYDNGMAEIVVISMGGQRQMWVNITQIEITND